VKKAGPSVAEQFRQLRAARWQENHGPDDSPDYRSEYSIQLNRGALHGTVLRTRWIRRVLVVEGKLEIEVRPTVRHEVDAALEMSASATARWRYKCGIWLR
jgi:hypothetical protein